MLYRDMLVKHKDTKMSLALRAKYMVIPSKIMQNYSVPGEDLRVDHVCVLSSFYFPLVFELTCNVCR